MDDGLGWQSPLKDKARAGHSARLFILSVVFKAFDDSVTLDSDLGAKPGGPVTAPPM
jgi:hypothetical protein